MPVVNVNFPVINDLNEPNKACIGTFCRIKLQPMSHFKVFGGERQYRKCQECRWEENRARKQQTIAQWQACPQNAEYALAAAQTSGKRKRPGDEKLIREVIDKIQKTEEASSIDKSITLVSEPDPEQLIRKLESEQGGRSQVVNLGKEAVEQIVYVRDMAKSQGLSIKELLAIAEKYDDDAKRGPTDEEIKRERKFIHSQLKAAMTAFPATPKLGRSNRTSFR